MWLIVLGQQGYQQAWATSAGHPYLDTLRKQGELVVNYDAVASSPLANEVALISGQGPTQQTAANCPTYTYIDPGKIGKQQQVLGDGCIYPQTTESLPQQFLADGLSWKAYVQGIGEGWRAAPVGLDDIVELELDQLDDPDRADADPSSPTSLDEPTSTVGRRPRRPRRRPAPARPRAAPRARPPLRRPRPAPRARRHPPRRRAPARRRARRARPTRSTRSAPPPAHTRAQQPKPQPERYHWQHLRQLEEPGDLLPGAAAPERPVPDQRRRHRPARQGPEEPRRDADVLLHLARSVRRRLRHAVPAGRQGRPRPGRRVPAAGRAGDRAVGVLQAGRADPDHVRLGAPVRTPLGHVELLRSADLSEPASPSTTSASSTTSTSSSTTAPLRAQRPHRGHRNRDRHDDDHDRVTERATTEHRDDHRRLADCAASGSDTSTSSSTTSSPSAATTPATPTTSSSTTTSTTTTPGECAPVIVGTPPGGGQVGLLMISPWIDPGQDATWSTRSTTSRC